MKRTVCLWLMTVLVAAGFFGCQDNPASLPTPGSTDTIDVSVPIFGLVSSSQVSDSIWTYEIALKASAYQPAATNAVMFGALGTNWNLLSNATNGVLSGGAWNFTFTVKNGPRLVNFSSKTGNWAQLDSLKKCDFYQASSKGGDLAIDFENGQLLHTSNVVTIHTVDTMYIVKTIVVDSILRVRDTVIDTVWSNRQIHDSIHTVDTVRVPSKTDTVMLGDLVKQVGNVDLGNGSFRTTLIFSPLLVKKNATANWVPFGAGFPPYYSWNKDSVMALGQQRPDGYYPLTYVSKPGFLTCDVGGDYNHAWANDSLLAKAPWGFKTPTGYVIRLYENKAGWVFPASLVYVDTTTKVVHDTTVRVDTVKTPQKIVWIIDSVFTIRTQHDTTVIRTHDTVTVMTIRIVKDTVQLPGKIAYITDTLRIYYVTHDTVRTKPDTVFVPIHVYDTTFVIRVIPPDTVFLPGRIIIVHDTLKQVNTDTIHVKDTVVFTAVDKGVAVDSSKNFLRDTSWLESNHLKGVVTEDTVVTTRAIHSVLWISPKGDSTVKRDTASSTKIYQYRADTISLVIAQYGSSVVGADTIYRFGVTVKAFAYSGKGDDSASLTGLADTSKWKFVGKIGGYFVFDAKLIGGTTYNFNFVGNKGTWAQQEILLLSPLAVKTGGNCDIVSRAVYGTGLVKP
ncbi:MAG: hypothetical protein PHE24_04970 [Patescibacteria group bacterium]|nr:hypothetical protein [Patescibacteria group bacterium]